MKTRTIEQTIYDFNELSEKAKYNAIGLYSPLEDFDPRTDYDQGCWIDLETNALESYEIGSWDTNPVQCRFSEVRFDTDTLIAQFSESLRDQRNLYRLCIAEWPGNTPSMGGLFFTAKNTNYMHTRLDIETDYPCRSRTPRVNKLLEAYREKLENHLRDCEHEVAKAISKEVEHLQSIEYFAELAECNKYQFTEDGQLTF